MRLSLTDQKPAVSCVTKVITKILCRAVDLLHAHSTNHWDRPWVGHRSAWPPAWFL